ncbi:MAG: phosphoribosylformylglycinamidine cyclo-ligase [Candidatus Omnitrophica bacterium]|nr:phosphoribosylformylglycinamidine cyclo-ligase [Candidatus Omnitrophota bacterium]
MPAKRKLTYKRSGVDIDRANRLVGTIGKMVNSTQVPGCMGSVGGFAGLFDPKKTGIKNPVLVSSTDGVGTKLKVAQLAGVHSTIGIDLVAMCVNDVICMGARPLFFLDYFSTGKLQDRQLADIIRGVVKGCREAGCALLGGETAEMPGVYPKGEYDLAGFCVGAVDRKKIIDGKRIKPGNVVLGIASSGFHSNGYSLVRKAFNKAQLRKHARMLLKPTTIYVKPVLELVRRSSVNGIVHITGGGFYDNIPRVLPEGAKAVIDRGSWKAPRVYDLLRDNADIPEKELYRTFNMGIGMTLILSQKEVAKAQRLIKKHGLKSWIIGDIVKGDREVEIH